MTNLIVLYFNKQLLIVINTQVNLLLAYSR